MWINNTFRKKNTQRGLIGSLLLAEVPDVDMVRNSRHGRRFSRKRKLKVEDDGQIEELEPTETMKQPLSEEEQRLKKAASIGTALMLVNSHRALFLLLAIVTGIPVIGTILGANLVAPQSVKLLQANNLMVNEVNEFSCEYLEDAIYSWLATSAKVNVKSPTEEEEVLVLWAQLLPKRCPFQADDGVITSGVCQNSSNYAACRVWNSGPENVSDANAEYYADMLGIRVGGISDYSIVNTSSYSEVDSTGVVQVSSSVEFSVRVLINENHSMSFT
jgi:hypothetical protein